MSAKKSAEPPVKQQGTVEIIIRDADGVEFHRHRHDVDDVDAAADHVAALEPEHQPSDRTLFLRGDRRAVDRDEPPIA